MLPISYRDIYVFTKKKNTKAIFKPDMWLPLGIRKGDFSFIQGVPIFCKNIISNFIMITLLTFKNTETTRGTDVILLIDRAKCSL